MWKDRVHIPWSDINRLDFGDLTIRLDEREKILEMIMMGCCRYLTHLTISGYQYREIFNVLLLNCRRITHFSIDMTDIDTYKICSQNLVEIIMSMKKLVYLRVVMKVFLSRNLANDILIRLPECMEEIHLIVPDVISYDMIKEFDEIAPVSILFCIFFFIL